MKSRFSKFLFVFGLYAVLHLAEACLLDCNCPKVSPFFDFFTLKSEVNNPAAEAGGLKITVAPDSVVYLACRESDFPGLISAAYSCSCDEPGDMGPKFPITSIHITADQIFNDTLPAGATLDRLFKIANSGYPGTHYGLDEVGQLYYYNYGFYPVYSEVLLLCSQAPVLSGVPYRFTITFTKSDGGMVSVVTDPVTW